MGKRISATVALSMWDTFNFQILLMAWSSSQAKVCFIDLACRSILVSEDKVLAQSR